MNTTTSKQYLTLRIGIDIGRVVMCPTDAVRGPDTSFLSASPERAREIPPAPGAATTIRALVEATGGQVWFVSKAGPRIASLTRDWFRHNDFHARTSTAPESIHFCIHRHEKREIAERLRLTHFIDDRRDVLEPMLGVVRHLYLFGVQPSPPPRWCTPAPDWFALSRLLLNRRLENG